MGGDSEELEGVERALYTSVNFSKINKNIIAKTFLNNKSHPLYCM